MDANILSKHTLCLRVHIRLDMHEDKTLIDVSKLFSVGTESPETEK